LLVLTRPETNNDSSWREIVVCLGIVIPPEFI